MSQPEIDRFIADLKSNETLRADATKALADDSDATPVERAVAFAATKGYAFTADEAKEHAKANAKADGKELTDTELDGVAGGSTIDPFPEILRVMSGMAGVAYTN